MNSVLLNLKALKAYCEHVYNKDYNSEEQLISNTIDNIEREIYNVKEFLNVSRNSNISTKNRKVH